MGRLDVRVGVVRAGEKRRVTPLELAEHQVGVVLFERHRLPRGIAASGILLPIVDPGNLGVDLDDDGRGGARRRAGCNCHAVIEAGMAVDGDDSGVLIGRRYALGVVCGHGDRTTHGLLH